MVSPRPAADPLDPELAHRAASDREAANQFVVQFGPWFEVQFKAATRKACPSRVDRIEFLQTVRSIVFERLQETLAKWKRGHLKAYLSRGIHNRARSHSRTLRAAKRSAPTVPVDDVSLSGGTSPEANLIAADRATVVGRILNDLLESLAARGDTELKWADAVRRMCLASESPKTYAHRVGVEPNTVAQWKKRGLEQLVGIALKRGYSLEDIL